MSAPSPAADSSAELADPPEFGLRYRFDDPTNPTEVTVYPDGCDGDPTTQWLTIDKGHSLPLEEIR